MPLPGTERIDEVQQLIFWLCNNCHILRKRLRFTLQNIQQHLFPIPYWIMM